MSWPTRCGTLMLASTRSAQAAVAVGVGGCVGVALALGAVVCDDDTVGVGVAATPQKLDVPQTTPGRRPPRCPAAGGGVKPGVTPPGTISSPSPPHRRTKRPNKVGGAHPRAPRRQKKSGTRENATASGEALA